MCGGGPNFSLQAYPASLAKLVPPCSESTASPEGVWVRLSNGNSPLPCAQRLGVYWDTGLSALKLGQSWADWDPSIMLGKGGGWGWGGRYHIPAKGLSSVQFSHSAISNSLRPHGLQHTRLPHISPTPRACSNSCPSSR